jgi:hypothetical protein
VQVADGNEFAFYALCLLICANCVFVRVVGFAMSRRFTPRTAMMTPDLHMCRIGPQEAHCVESQELLHMRRHMASSATCGGLARH